MVNIIEYQNLKLEIPEEIYLPSDDSYLLIENLKVKSDDTVLELGTGSGLIALVAAQIARKVIATEISPVSFECANHNVKINQLANKIEVRKGFLFEPILPGETFDLILFNPPYLPEDKVTEKKDDWLEKAWDGGKLGRKLIDPFIKQCKIFLRPAGRVQLIQSSLSNISKSCVLLGEQGFHVEISASKSFFFETIVVIDAFLEND